MYCSVSCSKGMTQGQEQGFILRLVAFTSQCKHSFSFGITLMVDKFTPIPPLFFMFKMFENCSFKILRGSYDTFN